MVKWLSLTASPHLQENRFLNESLLVEDVLYQPHWEPSERTAYRVVQAAP